MAKKHKKDKDKDLSKKKHRSRSRSKSVEVEVEKEKEKKKHHKHHHHKSKKRERKESSNSDDDVIFVPPPSKVAKVASPPPKKTKPASGSPTKRASSPPKRHSTPPPKKHVSPSPKKHSSPPPKKHTSPPPKKHSSPSPKKHSPPPPKKHSSPPPKRHSSPPSQKHKNRSESPEITPSSNSDASLSIHETNALRAKLGLKPLADSGASNGSSSTKDDFVHKPAENLTQKKISEKLRSRISEKKEKRSIEKKLAAVKALGEDNGDDDVSSWVNKSRSIEDERRKAAMKAKELDEMDEVFGIGDLVEEETKKEKHKVYSSRNLRGLTVEHNVEQFMEGRAVILTLKDAEVLGKDQSDTLVNVNMIDDERHKKNVMLKKQKPYNFSGIDDMEEGLDEHHVLKKYDEEIEGVKKQNFQIGQEDIALRKESIKKSLQEKVNMRIESLALPELKLANEYYSPEEMKIKKPKKKKIIKRKPLTADDLLQDTLVPTTSQFKSRGNKSEPMDIDSVDVKAEEESDPFLKRAIKKAQSLKSTHIETIVRKIPKVEEVLKEIKEEPEDPGSIVLNSTAEFCRTLGDIPTYGMAGNRDEEVDELLDFEKDKDKIPKIKTEVVEEDRGGWNDVEMDEKVVEVKPIEVPILEAEPDLGSGVAGALRMAVSKGYLEKETKNRPSASRISHLAAQNYSIDDKAHAVEDEKQGRRERYLGPTQDFKEKDGYKPNIKLEYIDDDGHLLSAKEAFRYLSHKFHGKGPGKNKVEKRMKKNEQEGLMKQMSSTDTPLGTLSKLQHKQKETHSPFVVLSGSKLNPTALSKTKMMK